MVAKFYMNFNNNNEVHTHQGMDSRHMQKVTVLTKIALREHYTQYSMIDLYAILTKNTLF